MKTKDGVILAGLQLPMRHVLKHADKVWKANGQELTITSALDGVHSAGSYHPFGYALDLRTRYFADVQAINCKFQLKAALENAVGLLEAAKYVIVVENDHIHVQYNA